MELNLTKYQDDLLFDWEAKAEFYKAGVKTTVCILTLKNGFEIVGSSACVNPDDFNQEIGNHYALVDAINKLDELAGFARSLKH